MSVDIDRRIDSRSSAVINHHHPTHPRTHPRLSLFVILFRRLTLVLSSTDGDHRPSTSAVAVSTSHRPTLAATHAASSHFSSTSPLHSASLCTPLLFLCIYPRLHSDQLEAPVRIKLVRVRVRRTEAPGSRRWGCRRNGLMDSTAFSLHHTCASLSQRASDNTNSRPTI